MANETVLFKRGDSATITSTPITDGQILFDTSGNGKMYLDNGTTRLAMGGSVTIDSTLSKTSTNAVQNKAVTGNILNSLAEVSAATQQNTIAGALALKEVNSSLTANNSDGTFIDLSMYTSKMNMYTFTSDGYLYMQFDGAKLTYTRVNLHSANNKLIASLCTAGIGGEDNMYSNDIKSIFVKKGMKVYIAHNTSNNNLIRFYPIS